MLFQKSIPAAPTSDPASLGDSPFSLRERLYAHLRRHPSGQSEDELLQLLFSNPPRSKPIARAIFHELLGADPNFAFDSTSGKWRVQSFDSAQAPIDEAGFVVVDLETNGLATQAGQIIEIGAFRVIGYKITASFQSLVKPEGKLSSFVSRLTGIRESTLRSAPPIEEVLPSFRQFLGLDVLTAHNAAFDVKFIDLEFRRLFHLGIKNPVLCTLKLSRTLFPRLGSYSLDSLARAFNLKQGRRHRAYGDAHLAAQLLLLMLDRARALGLKTARELLDLADCRKP